MLASSVAQWPGLEVSTCVLQTGVGTPSLPVHKASAGPANHFQGIPYAERSRTTCPAGPARSLPGWASPRAAPSAPPLTAAASGPAAVRRRFAPASRRLPRPRTSPPCQHRRHMYERDSVIKPSAPCLARLSSEPVNSVPAREETISLQNTILEAVRDASQQLLAARAAIEHYRHASEHCKNQSRCCMELLTCVTCVYGPRATTYAG